MARRELLHILESAGLDEIASRLYLAGLVLSDAPASAYAGKTGMNRITAYNHLESLVRKGIFVAIESETGRRYYPIPPEELSVEVRKNADALHRVLPELRAMRGAHHRSPQVMFYQGWEGVRRVYEDTLTAEGEILNFANSAIIREQWHDYDREYVMERVKRKIRLRGIAPDDEVGRRVHGEDTKRLREIRLIPAKEFDFTNEINIYDDKVSIISFPENPDDLFGVIIESKEVAATQRQIFAMAWAYAGSLL